MDMNSLYDKIAAADKFAPPKADTLPVVDQSSQANFALQWAARQQPAQPAPEVPKMPPIVPVAN